jgi:hypothetical protein
VGSAQVFRLAGWTVALVVSAKVRDVMRDASGAVFQEV